MSFSPNNPYFVNPESATNPWTTPLQVLQAVFYPEIPAYAYPNFYVTLGIFAIFLICVIAALVVRWNKYPRFFSRQHGYIVPNTSNLFTFWIGMWLLMIEARMWRQIDLWRNKSSYYGVHTLEALCWLSLGISAWTLVHGISLAASLTIARSQGGASAAKPQHQKTTYMEVLSNSMSPSRALSNLSPTWINILSISLPLAFSLPVLGLGITSEVLCDRQYLQFLDAVKLAKRGAKNWDQQQGSIDDELVTRWDGLVTEIQNNNCLSYEHIEYLICLIWYCLVFLGTVFGVTLLYCKLKNQAIILNRAANTVRGAQENASTAGFSLNATTPLGSQPPSGVPSPKQLSPPDEEVLDERKLSSPGTESSEIDATPDILDSSGNLKPGMGRRGSAFGVRSSTWNSGTGEAQRLSKRAKSMNAAARGLVFQAILSLFCLILYITDTAIKYAKGHVFQTNGDLAVIFYVTSSWVYTLIGGGSIILLVFMGMNPNRSPAVFGNPVSYPHVQDSNSSIDGEASHPSSSSRGRGVPRTDEEDEEDDRYLSLVGFHGSLRTTRHDMVAPPMVSTRPQSHGGLAPLPVPISSSTSHPHHRPSSSLNTHFQNSHSSHSSHSHNSSHALHHHSPQTFALGPLDRKPSVVETERKRASLSTVDSRGGMKE